MSGYRGTEKGTRAPQSLSAGNRRLSKPKTSSSLLSPVSPSATLDSSPVSSRISPSNSGIGKGTGSLSSDDSIARRKSRQMLRDHIFGTDEEEQRNNESATVKDDAMDAEPRLEPPRGKKGRMARTSTIIGKRASVRLSLPLGKSQSRLSLQKLGTETPEETDKIINEIKQKAYDDSVVAHNHIASPIKTDPEDMSVQFLPLPIRRRSLFTPGLATRNPNDLLRKPPASPNRPMPKRTQTGVADTHQRYYDRSLSASSPLDRLAALDLAKKNQRFSVPRSATPVDLDYGRLNALSDLRITNGSPAPSLRSTMTGRRKSSAETYCQQSFHTASEGHVSDDEQEVLTLKEIHRQSGEFVSGLSNSRQGLLVARMSQPQLHGSRPPTRERSPLRLERQVSNSTFNDNDYDSIAQSKWSTISSLHDGNGLDCTSILAQQYSSDIPSSPFVSSTRFNNSVSSFHPTSKANEFEDELFDDPVSRPASTEPMYESWSKSQNEGVKGRPGSFVTISHSTSVTTTHSATGTVSVTHDECYPSKTVSIKDDSGYSSGASWKDQPNTPIYKSESYTEGDSYFVEITQLPGSRTSSEIQDISQAKPYGTVLHEPRSTRASYDEFSRVREAITPPSAHRGRASARPPSKSNSSWQCSTTLPITYDTSTVTAASSTDRRARSSSRGPPKKLQKKPRPKSQPPPVDHITVQCNRKLSGSDVPRVPVDVAARHALRLQDFPLLEHTVHDLNCSRSEFNPSHEVHFSEPLRFPSPVHNATNTRSKSRKISSRILSFSRLSAEQKEETERRKVPEPTKAEKRLSRQWQSEFTAANISDFGDVCNSLGESPYDIASFSRRETSPSKRNSLVHPHQFTTALPRAKSMFGMDDLEAAESARLRSHHRISTKSSRPIRIQPQNSPPVSAPPTKTRFDDRGGIPGKMPRSISMSFDAPPVPAIPIRSKVEHMERQRAGSSTMQTKQIIDPPTRPAPEPPTLPDWNSARMAWAERRKSAGDGLRQRPDLVQSSSEQPLFSHLSRERLPCERSVRPATSAHDQSFDVPKRVSRSQQIPQSSQDKAPPVSTGHNLKDLPSTPVLGVQEGLVARLSGRFENGLAFGYEPGHGVGGSAGTRGSGMTASRKGLDWSRGYGVDLTDIPVFLTPVRL